MRQSEKQNHVPGSGVDRRVGASRLGCVSRRDQTDLWLNVGPDHVISVADKMWIEKIQKETNGRVGMPHTGQERSSRLRCH